MEKSYWYRAREREGSFNFQVGVFFYYSSWVNFSILEQDTTMNDIPKNDMRFKVKDGQESKIPKVLEKFLGGTYRELTPEREFIEELIETGILDKEIFSSPKFYKTHTHSIDYDMWKDEKGGFCSFYRYEVF